MAREIENVSTRSDADWDESRNYRRVMSCGTLAGDTVRNTAGEDLGKVKEIMLDVPTGRVAYAVLSFGGFLGMGDKLFAVPWQALTLNERDKEFILNVDKEMLKNAPGFDKDNWPDMADPQWGSQIFKYYGYTPYWEADVTGKTDELDRREREGRFDRDRNRTLKSGGGGGL
ncbi:MAG: PRC-barrel domain-containing protein [Acidobacteriia bacterium]|nr:PRC-barrel domain-containing protein [Terriglobia bacterium]